MYSEKSMRKQMENKKRLSGYIERNRRFKEAKLIVNFDKGKSEI